MKGIKDQMVVMRSNSNLTAKLILLYTKNEI